MQNSKIKIQNYKLNLKTFNFLVTLLTFACLLLPSSVSAQVTVDPSIWQTGATGLKLQTFDVKQQNGSFITEKKTAGLMFHLQDQGWPNLGLPGGGQSGWNQLVTPVGIDLGMIKSANAGIGGSGSSLSLETADWSSNLLSYNLGVVDEIKLWVSRLTPALLLQTQVNNLRLFAGNVDKYTANGGTVTNQTPAPSYPKWIAYSSGGTVQVRELSSTSLPLPALDQNWVLVWYGNNSHFVDTKTPNPYPFPLIKNFGRFETQGLPYFQAYQADAPVLLVFQNAPTSAIHSPEGGIDLAFSQGAGYATLLPVLGRDYPKSTDTEIWGTTAILPPSLISKINFWVQRSCDFPVGVSESYNYDGVADSANFTEDVTFINTGCSGTKFAPIPSTLSLAKDAFGTNLTFSENLVDGNLPTEFGPTLGISSTSPAYSWSLKGLKTYTDGRRVTGAGAVPADLTSDLTSEIDKIVADGHYTPWIFNNRYHNLTIGEVYWHNPADTIYQLTEIIPALPEPQKTNLINYLRSERTSYPPETVYKLPWTQGKERGPFSAISTEPVGGSQNVSQAWDQSRQDVFYSRVPLYNFYSLFRYYSLTGDPVPQSVIDATKTVLNNDMGNQDWATFSWFRGSPDPDNRVAIVNMQRHFAGLLGLVNLARSAGDTSLENLSRSLLAKAAVSRIAMSKYPRFLYSASLIQLPASPSWQIDFTAGRWYAGIFNWNWVTTNDDARQVVYVDQFGVTAYDHTGFGEPFRDQVGATFYPTLVYREIVPELGRMLSDLVKTETEIYLQKVESLMPNWYMSFNDAIFGGEHDNSHPIDAFQIFMAKSWISGESAQSLEKFIDLPYLSSGDLFYVQKLAEVVKSYQGLSWTTQSLPTPTPTPTPSPTPVPSSSPTPTPTPTPTPVLSATPTPTPTPTSSPSTLSITITNPANGSQVSGTVVVTADTTPGTNGINRVVIQVNGSSICTDYSSPYSCNWTVPVGSGVSYTIKGWAIDNAGLKKSTSITVISQ